ncbi:uncharacterized protein JCM6883_000849 [Sporobolomyces salmoneus]|uniref:uncharacterized protein n=1 Tax=Sporobolomyces salmoneus TaxID=183962 RepID=UPI0031819A83
MFEVPQATSADYQRSLERKQKGVTGRMGPITPSTSVEDLGWKGYSMNTESTRYTSDGRDGNDVRRAVAVTPPPRKDSINDLSLLTTSSRQASPRAHNDDGSPVRTRQGSQLLSPDRLPPPIPPILDSTPASPSSSLPREQGSPVAPPRLKFVTSNLSPSHSPRNSLPTASSSTGNPSPSSSTFQTASRDVSSKTLSAQSTLSVATSNSSHLPVPQTSPYPASTSSFTSDPEVTAGWIRMLYARLEAQGVRGDGWDEGKERTRDGIINREIAEGGQSAIRSLDQRKSVAAPLNQDEEAKADQVLRRVDRYGFFSQSHPSAVACQHNRLATLSASAFANLPSPSGSTSKKGARKSTSTPPEPRPQMNRSHPNRQSTVSLLPSSAISPQQTELETKRIAKWSEMLTVGRRDSGGNAQDWTVSSSSWWSGRIPGAGGGDKGKYRKFQRRVFKGIPDRWRRAVWGLLMERMAEEVGARGRTPTLEQLKREYEHFVQLPSAQDVQIDLDVPRTISGHVLFHTRYGQGQRALFHVLHAFGLRSENVGGYCQGMGPIAATLLCYFEPERAYAGMCRLFDQYQLENIFEPGFPGLMEVFYVQERVIELLMPDVHKAFNEQYISTSAYATKWYITLFSNSVPFATQVRLWDGLLLEGVDFLIVTALAIIWQFQVEFTSPTASFESILSTLSSYFDVESDDALLRWIRKTLRIKGLRSKMKHWRDEWKGFVADGSSGARVT